MGGRPRTPTAILDARGAFKKDPQRRRDSEPEVREPIGAPPSDLSLAELVWWNEIVNRAPLGVLTQADWISVLACAKLCAEMMADFSAFSPGKLGRLQSLLGAFGMTPSDRAKLSIPKAKKDVNPFAALDD